MNILFPEWWAHQIRPKFDSSSSAHREISKHCYKQKLDATATKHSAPEHLPLFVGIVLENQTRVLGKWIVFGNLVILRFEVGMPESLELLILFQVLDHQQKHLLSQKWCSRRGAALFSEKVIKNVDSTVIHNKHKTHALRSMAGNTPEGGSGQNAAFVEAPCLFFQKQIIRKKKSPDCN